MKIKINDTISQNIQDIVFESGETSNSILLQSILLMAHPVGSYYWSSEPTNPETLFGGTWEQIKDKFIIAAGETHVAGTDYGSNVKNLSHAHTSAAHTHTTGNHTLTVAEMPNHNHDMLANKGASGDNAGIEHTWGTGYSSYDSNSCGYRGGSQAHNHGDTGSTTPGATGSSLSSSFDITPASVAAYCWRRIA